MTDLRYAITFVSLFTSRYSAILKLRYFERNKSNLVQGKGKLELIEAVNPTWRDLYDEF